MLNLPDFVNLVASIIAILLFVGTVYLFFQTRKFIWRVQSKRFLVPNYTILNYLDAGLAIQHLVNEAHRLRPPVDHIVGINRGGAIVGGCIAKKLNFPREGENSFFLLNVTCEYSEYLDDSCADEDIEVTEQRNDDIPIKEKQVLLLVDDSLRTASHMRAAERYLKDTYKGVEIKKFVLLDAASRLVGPEIHRREISLDAWAFRTGGTVFWPWDPDDELRKCREDSKMVQRTVRHLFSSHAEHGDSW